MKKIYNALFDIKSQSTGQIEAAFATMRTWDLDNDWTEPGAFGTQENIILEGWNHDSKLPVGRGRIFEKGNDAIFQGQFFLQTQNGLDHFEVVKEMSKSGSQEFSYSFNILKSEIVTHNGNPGRRLISLLVMGVSPVTRGAGINTRLILLKGAGGTWLSGGLSPANVRALISEMTPLDIRGLLKALNDVLNGMQAKEFDDLNVRLEAAGGPSLSDAWRSRLLAEGHSPAWVEAVIESEIAGLEGRLLDQNPLLEYQPGEAHAQALRMVNLPVRHVMDHFPEAGSSVRSPLVFV